MNRSRPLLLTIVLLLAVSPALAATAGGRPSEPGMAPVSLRFTDMPTAKVLEALFAATGARADIDTCVTGRITIALDDVPLGTALDAIARLADLNISRGTAPATFRITCRDGAGARGRGQPAARSGETVELRFRIETVDARGRREVVAEPRLITPVGESAYLAPTGNVLDYTLTDDGELIAKPTRPEWAVRVIVAPGRSGSPREVRGILEIATEAPRASETATVSLTQPFHATITGEDEVRLVATELSGTAWVLTLASAD